MQTQGTECRASMERPQLNTFRLPLFFRLKPLLPLFQNSFSSVRGPLFFLFPFLSPLARTHSKEHPFHALPLLPSAPAIQGHCLRGNGSKKSSAPSYSLRRTASSASGFPQGNRTKTSCLQTAALWPSNSFQLSDCCSWFPKQQASSLIT